MLYRNHVTGGFGLDPDALMEELRRELTRTPLPREAHGAGGHAHEGLELSDAGDRFVIRVDVPGVTESDLEITYDRGAVSIRARRDAPAADGWVVRRKERASFEWSRAAVLPAPIEADRAEAKLCRGVLEISLPKTPDAAPRRVKITSAN